MPPRNAAPALVPLLAAMSLTACEILGTSSDETLSLSFSVPRPPALTSGARASVIPITDDLHTIDLQNVELTINRITIEEAGRDDHDDDDHDDDEHDGKRDHDGRELRVGAVTVDLPLEGGVITPINASLPEATYEELELEISHVRARGTFDGEPFDVTVMINVTIELELDPPFQVTSADDRLNITVTVDPSVWFLDSLERLIDPRGIQLDAGLRRALERQIRASFHAFEDPDHDGHSEHHDRS